MQKSKDSIDSCLEKLKKLESEYNQALQNHNIIQLPMIRQKIKQQNEKLRTVRRSNSSN